MSWNVFKNPIEVPDPEQGTVANYNFSKEHAQIFGNKRLVLVLSATPNTTEELVGIDFTIDSQKNEKGEDVNLFTFNPTNRTLIPNQAIDNIKKLKFHHLIGYAGDNSSGDNNDANDQTEVALRLTTIGIPLQQIDESLHIFSNATEIGNNETITKRVITEPEPPADPTQEFNLDTNINIGWVIKQYNNPVVNVASVQVTLEINYYDPQETGGN